MQQGKNKLIIQAILFVVVFVVAFAATRYILKK
jgi:hypothetical protein